ncbi:MAG: 4Fe-4S dicluster domain-containing protein [Desulfovibrio sp.]|nr:4Fe-4S dicluster domain-containing protein [Desulfovibrio sp.]
MNDTLCLNACLHANGSDNPSFSQKVATLSQQAIHTCYQCGNCSAGCPAAFAYDLQVNQIMRAVQLEQKDLALGAKSLWLCLGCATCSLRCPNAIDVARVMDTLRHLAREEKKISVPVVEKFWLSFLNCLRAFGRSYEIGTMVLYMLRSLRLTTDVDLAPQALAKGKLGLLPHSHPGKDAVGRIFTRFAQKEAQKLRESKEGL